ncbi:MAG TPA: 2-amino-4-hydroxy-6-hydroxymethyldihydropteridine diphosphokinase [Cyclobacteriaceae bacterium]|nr:2-amino-4-hydroxy-6-hydroxymethyldihydropteridine diphosphokinase [Cyclobacteriaceae bacterium]
MTGGIFLMLGSNLGDRQRNLSNAVGYIGNFARIVRMSSVYATSAWGNANQPDFLNQAIEVDTTLPPQDLLKNILEVEIKIGRERKEKWGPRTIDIDILFFNDKIVKTNDLTLPHPEVQNRKFVLIPLREIAATFIHPVFKKSVAQLDDECTDNLEVKRLPHQHREQSS